MDKQIVIHDDTVDPKTKHELTTLVASLDMMYWDVNDATMLDLPEDLVEAMDNAKGAIEELKGTVEDFLKESEQKVVTIKHSS